MNQFQQKKLEKLFLYLYNNNFYFHDLLQNMDFSNNNIRDIYRLLRPITKKEIRDNITKYLSQEFIGCFQDYDEMISELNNVSNLSPHHDKVISKNGHKWYIETTSGTTGMPFAVIKNNTEVLIEAAYLYKFRKRLSPEGIDNGFLLDHPIDPVLKEINYIKEHESFEIVFDHMLKKNPKWIFSTALILKKFVDYIINNDKYKLLKNLSFDFIETTSQTYTVEEKMYIEQIFNTKIINNYGCREFWNIGYQCSSGYLHLNNEYLIVDIIDENGEILNEKGKIGEVVITSLTNKAMPFVKYYLGDLARILQGCSCGWNGPIIVLEEGRKNEKLVNTKYFGNVVFRKVLKGLYINHKFNDLKRIKIVQDGGYHLSIYLDKEKKYDKYFEEKFLEVSRNVVDDINFNRFSFDFFYEDFDTVLTDSIYKEQIFISDIRHIDGE